MTDVDYAPLFVIETLGSYWYFDEGEKHYYRTPKTPPRENPEWGDENAGRLQDYVWHPYSAFRFGQCPFVSGVERHDDGLIIDEKVWGPQATEIERLWIEQAGTP